MIKALFSSLSLSLALLCVLFVAIMAKRMWKQYKCASNQPGFTDLLDYALLGPQNTIILKNGALLKTFKVKAHDLSYADSALISRTQELTANAFRKLGGNFILNVDFIRQKVSDVEDCEYKGNDKAKKLYYKRKEFFRTNSTYTHECYLTITSLSHSLGSIRSIASLFDDESLKRGITFSSDNEITELRIADNKVNSIIVEFSKSVDEIKNSLENTLKLEECTFLEDPKLNAKNLCVSNFGVGNGSKFISHETVNFLKYCISGKKLELKLPKGDYYLDSLLSSDDFTSGTAPKLSDRYIVVVAIEGLPLESEFNILQRLSTLDFDYRFSTRYISYDSFTSQVLLEKNRRLWAQKKHGFIAQFFNSKSDNENQDAVEQLNDISDAKKNLVQNSLSFGSYCANIIFSGTDATLLEKQALKCVQAIEASGFGARIETVNATEAYLGSLPGHCLENVRRALIPNTVLTDLLPLNQVYTGESVSPNFRYGKNKPSLMTVRTLDGLYAHLNLHDTDLANTLVVGPPGSGKSVFLGSLIPSFLKYDDMKIFVFDKGNSFYGLTRALKGNHIKLENGKGIRFCPLAKIDTPNEKDEALRFLEKLFISQGYETDLKLKDDLRDALTLLSDFDKHERTLSTMCTLLPRKELKTALSAFTNSVIENSILDGDKDPSFNAELTVFECGQFFEKAGVFLFPTLQCIFNLINKSIMNGKAGAIIIDEAWMMLANEEFSKQLISWIKTLRKHNVAIVLATQSINDLSKASNIGDFLDCIKTRIFLPNKDANTEALKGFYKKLSLSDSQIDAICKAKPKHTLFLQKDINFMPFSLALSEPELKLLSLSENDKSYVDEMYEQYQEEFAYRL